MQLLCLSLVVVRCQPLRRALCLISITNYYCFYIQFYVFGYHHEL
ncbi:superoxide dismutase [Vibrio cholerae]|nr:superoxide dismutase [Vibrio cholerae]EGR1308041.1 superoxide dismutase [Vibrio cholerae]MDV2319215.1 superoxide dismutase [Vibrio cholerae]TXY62125.1 superoxide dismutase [Vibrio cholerae]